MTKSIEEQAEARAINLRQKHGDMMPTFENAKVSYIKGAKARDAQWSAVLNELRGALKKISQTNGLKYLAIDSWPKDELIKTINYDTEASNSAITKADQMLKEMGVSNG